MPHKQHPSSVAGKMSNAMLCHNKMPENKKEKELFNTTLGIVTCLVCKECSFAFPCVPHTELSLENEGYAFFFFTIFMIAKDSF